MKLSETIDRWIKIYGTAIIVYGVYNLLGTGAYRHFSMMFKGLPAFVTVFAYLFTIIYGVCGVYCGIKIIKFEEWARKVIVVFSAVSVVSSFLLGSTVMSNLKDFLFSGNSDIPLDMAASVYRYAVFFTVIMTVFELSIIVFFTRSKVIEQFRSPIPR